MGTRSIFKRTGLALLLPAAAFVAVLGVGDQRGNTDPAQAAGPIGVRALAPDIVNYFVDGDQGPNAAIPGAGLINPEDGLNLIEIMFPGDQAAVLGGNMDFYPDAQETNLIEAFAKSDSPPGPVQMNITAGQQLTPGLDGKLTIVAHFGRPATHGGTYSGDAETGMVTFGVDTPGFIYHEAVLATAAPHGQGPVDPTFESVTCGSVFSYLAGFDPFTGAGKADFADGDCDGVIHGPLNLNDPLSLIGSCLAQYLVGPLIPNDPTCKEDSLAFAHLMAASPSSALGVHSATVDQAPAPDAGMAGIGAPTTGGSGSVPFEVMGDPVGFAAQQNPHCNAGALPTCFPDPLLTGNAAPQDCQPQPAMDFGNGGVVFNWDQIDNTDSTLALGLYTPVSADGRLLARHRMTWTSSNPTIVRTQENFSVSFNAPTALPYPLAGIIGANLLCSGTTAGTVDVTVALGLLGTGLSTVFPVTVEDAIGLKLDMDITNGAGVCDPIDNLANVPIGQATLKVGVCLINHLGISPVAAFQYNVTYDDTKLTAVEVPDVSPAVDDNPDANVGGTSFLSATYPTDLGAGWTCDGGAGIFPQGDNNPTTGAAAGNAFSGSCGSGAGPNTLLQGPLGVITFDALQLGIDQLAIQAATVTDNDFVEIGSCNPSVDVAMACVGGTVLIGACPGTPNSDPEVRGNGPTIDGDDGTWPKHDAAGDICDTDDDNDGLVDVAELTGVMCGGVPTLPIDVDSDGDHQHDGWECANGSNPLDPASKSTASMAGDSDNDRIPDLWEARGYALFAPDTDADDDGCHDMVETGSINGNRVLDDSDRMAVARGALHLLVLNAEQDYVLDMNKNGVVDDSDRLFTARAVLLPDWLPKSCP